MQQQLWLDLRNVSQQLDDVIKYESGAFDETQTIMLFQSLIESGLAWTLCDSYARTAAELIDLGVCHNRMQTLRRQKVLMA
jgi:hypothetical protein